jgi:hypothetical protein
MNREGICKGDCAQCELVKEGKVDMVACAIDQTFQRVLRMEKKIESLVGGGVTTIAELPTINE